MCEVFYIDGRGVGVNLLMNYDTKFINNDI